MDFHIGPTGVAALDVAMRRLRMWPVSDTPEYIAHTKNIWALSNSKQFDKTPPSLNPVIAWISVWRNLSSLFTTWALAGYRKNQKQKNSAPRSTLNGATMLAMCK